MAAAHRTNQPAQRQVTKNNPTSPSTPATAEAVLWHVSSPEQVLERLGASKDGLTSAEAARRLAEHGPNELQETNVISPLGIFFGQFNSLIVWLLILAGVVAGALGEIVDAIAILAIVLLNGLIGFYQEFKAGKSIAALRKMTAPHARIRRDGKSLTVPASQLVIGDILEAGSRRSCGGDARLLEATSLRCVESALTGESEAVNKAATILDDSELPLGDRENMLFKGTSVAAGQGVAVVVATGMKTELGRIAGLIQEAGVGERTPLQEKLESFGRVLVWASLGIVALLFVLGLVRGMGFIEMFMTSVAWLSPPCRRVCPPWSPSLWRSVCSACPGAVRWCASCRRSRRSVRPASSAPTKQARSLWAT